MLSRLQKLSKNMILYSVLLSDFEKLDFKTDALAGIRANYFNSNRSAQSDTTDVELDGRKLNLTYSMKNGEPLSWKITKNNQPYQNISRMSDFSYCVMSYNDNGAVYKRVYFDKQHIWQRSDYFDREIESKLIASVSPRYIDGVLTLYIEKYADDVTKDCTTLYPSEQRDGVPCAALVYSNTGMIWYDARFAPVTTAQTETSSQKRGFVFTKSDFCMTNDSPLDLEHAAPLTNEDSESTDIVFSESVVEEEKPYSAYDKIQDILLEAQKTNKTIFGQIADYTDPGEKSEDLEVASAEPTTASGEELQEAHPDVPTYAVCEEPEADLEIITPNGVYSYYGSIDSHQQRVGRGRTTAPDGTLVYEGEYSFDKRNGFGICYYKDGSPNYVGDWTNGSRSGCGVGFRQSDGTFHAGKWLENKPCGIGTRFDSEGNFLDVCSYHDGVRHGNSICYDDEGRIVLRVWENGELISERVIYDGE